MMLEGSVRSPPCQICFCTGCPARLYQVYLLVFFGISKRSVSESSSNADGVRYCCSSSLSVDIINVFDNGLCGLQRDRRF